jgi:hypothetical protein
MRKQDIFWVASIGCLAVLDGIFDRKCPDWTLSYCGRRWFRTHEPDGALAFTLGLMAGGFVFQRHIVKGGPRGDSCL